MARQAIPATLFLLPVPLGVLADEAGMGWELITLLATVLALAVTGAQRARIRHARPIAAAGLAAGCALLLATGDAVLPAPLAATLPFATLLLSAALCDGRALATALALLAGAALLRLPLEAALAMAAGLAAVAGVVQAGLVLLARRATHRREVIAPPRPHAVPLYTSPREPLQAPTLLVQAERTPEGALRLAVAAATTGRLRVSVR
jgi:hypothetical protein